MTTTKKAVKSAKSEALPQDINGCMAAIMRDITHIGKDQTNQAQKFKYRGIDQVYNDLHGLMAKYGVFMTAAVHDKEREERTTRSGALMAYTTLHLSYTFHAPDGSTVVTSVIGEGMDSGDKSSNKAMAVGHKYALLQAFLIPTEEQKDPDAESPEVAPKPAAPKKPSAKLTKEIAQAEKDLELAASYGTETFRGEWRKVSKEVRSSIPQDKLEAWKKAAQEADKLNEADKERELEEIPDGQ